MTGAGQGPTAGDGRMIASLHRFFHTIAWVMAVVGGAVLLALVLMTCTSILGRTASEILHAGWVQATMPGLAQTLLDAGVGPIFGDYEFLVAGLAFSIFCFLGWCQITAGHATVDIFTDRLDGRKRRLLQMVIEVIFAAALILIAIQLQAGARTMLQRNSTTFLLQYPLWWNYAAALVPAVLTAAIGVWMAFVRIAEVIANRSLITVLGAEH